MDKKENLASRLAGALWNCYALRHGMFTFPDLRKICEQVIIENLKELEEKTAHYNRLLAHVSANANRHSWYGPCDGYGPNGSCSECDRMV